MKGQKKLSSTNNEDLMHWLCPVIPKGKEYNMA